MKRSKKSNFYKKKRLSKIDEIDVDKILVSKKESYGTKNSLKYFIGYDDDGVIRPLSRHPLVNSSTLPMTLHLGILFPLHPASSLFGTQQQLTNPPVKSSSFPLWKNHVSQGLLFC